MHIFIMRPGAIGDTLLLFPVLQALRIQYKHIHITLVSNPAVLPLALNSGLADQVFDYEDARWSQLFLPSTQVSETRKPPIKQKKPWNEGLSPIDIALCFLRDPEKNVEQNLHATGIPHVIVAPGRPPDDEKLHIVTYLSRIAGVKWEEEQPCFPSSFSYSPAPQLHCIAIHPGSGGSRKCWPVARFAAVISVLWEKHIAVLLLIGPADHERLAELQHLLPVPTISTLYQILVDAPLLTVVQRLRHCHSYLGNDSGLTHLAALLGLPTIALFGPSDPAIWRPIGPHVTILHQPVLEDLTIHTVLSHFPHLKTSQNLSKHPDILHYT